MINKKYLVNSNVSRVSKKIDKTFKLFSLIFIVCQFIPSSKCESIHGLKSSSDSSESRRLDHQNDKKKLTPNTHHYLTKMNSVSNEAFQREREFSDLFKKNYKKKLIWANDRHLEQLKPLKRKSSSRTNDHKKLNKRQKSIVQQEQENLIRRRVRRRATDIMENAPHGKRKKIRRKGKTNAVIDINRKLTLGHLFSVLSAERYELEKEERNLLEYNLWVEKILARRQQIKEG